jgi:hypothetical protein
MNSLSHSLTALGSAHGISRARLYPQKPVVDDIHGSTREDKQGHEKVSKYAGAYSELECYGIDC